MNVWMWVSLVRVYGGGFNGARVEIYLWGLVLVLSMEDFGDNGC